MTDSDEDIDPLMGPVADLMTEYNLASTTTHIEKPMESIEILDHKINLMDYLSFFNIHLLFRNIFNYILDIQWYKQLQRHVPNSEQNLNSSQIYPSLKRLILLLIVSRKNFISYTQGALKVLS